MRIKRVGYGNIIMKDGWTKNDVVTFETGFCKQDIDIHPISYLVCLSLDSNEVPVPPCIAVWMTGIH